MWTVTGNNSMLYADERLALLYEHLKPGGILTIWSAVEVQGFAERLRRVFESVEIFSVPVRTGEPDVIYAASRL